MLIRQSKHTFIRCTEKYGYITNQMTRHDRVYDEVGADFLKQITREPRDIEDIVKELMLEYADIGYETLKADFEEFVQSLEKELFVFTGDSLAEIEAKDVDFTYKIGNPKTMVEDFTQHTEEEVNENTQDFFFLTSSL